MRVLVQVGNVCDSVVRKGKRQHSAQHSGHIRKQYLQNGKPWQGFPDYCALAARGAVSAHGWVHTQSPLKLCTPWQGFPDYFALAARGGERAAGWVRAKSVTERYQQMGNAVSPLVATALGRCLVLAAGGRPLGGAAVVPVPDPELAEVRPRLPG